MNGSDFTCSAARIFRIIEILKTQSINFGLGFLILLEWNSILEAVI